MPRPHIPQHLSLSRIKSSANGQPHLQNNGVVSTPGSAPSTPQPNSRAVSPTRSSAAAPNPSADAGKNGDHKGMGLVLRVQVQKARNLAPKDKSGTSDPYLVLTMGEAKEATSVVTKTLHPEWNQTFEFPVTAADSALLEVICWDKDRFKKDYMGEFDVVLEEMFSGDRATAEPKWFKLEGRRTGRKKKKSDEVSGEVLLKFSIFDPINSAATEQQIVQKFRGVVASGQDGESDSDDEDLLSRLASRDLDDGLKTPDGTPTEKGKKRRQQKIKKMKHKNKLKAYEFNGMSDVAGVLFLEINRITDLPPEKNSTRTTFDMDPFVVTSLGRKTYRTRVVNHNLNPVYDEKLVFNVQKHEVNYSLHFAVVDRDKFSGNDFVGTVSFPVDKISNLAPEADPETGLYRLPDPDAVEARTDEPRRKRFRLPMSRSTSQNNLSRNNSSNNLTKLTRTTSNNSLKADQQPSRPGMRRMESENDVIEHLSMSPTHQRPPPTSAPSYSYGTATSYSAVPPNSDSSNGQFINGQEDKDSGMYAYELPLELKKKERWHDKHNPVLYVKAKYLPYRALRQQFWRAMLKQYDADDSGKIDKVELITMLDTLGSTLHNSTIDGFFARWKDENERNGLVNESGTVLTVDQAVICLEEQLMKSRDTQSHMHRPHWDRSESARSGYAGSGNLTPGWLDTSPEESPGGNSPYLTPTDKTKDRGVANGMSNLNPSSTSIPQLEISDISDASQSSPPTRRPLPPEQSPSLATISPQISRQDSWGQESEAELFEEDSKEEHVVEIQECPICHMPRLDARGRRGKGGRKRRNATDADIITHIATCASSDWRAVNNLVMAGFVTSSQAQRKWYSKVVSKITYGGYKLGANSANILVQDRMTVC